RSCTRASWSARRDETKSLRQRSCLGTGRRALVPRLRELRSLKNLRRPLSAVTNGRRGQLELVLLPLLFLKLDLVGDGHRQLESQTGSQALDELGGELRRVLDALQVPGVEGGGVAEDFVFEPIPAGSGDGLLAGRVDVDERSVGEGGGAGNKAVNENKTVVGQSVNTSELRRHDHRGGVDSDELDLLGGEGPVPVLQHGVPCQRIINI